MECWRCERSFRKEGKQLEKWGNVHYCKSCAKLMTRYTNGKEFMKLEISLLPSDVTGRYDFENGLMELGGGFREDMASRTVSHESVHHTLFRRIGLKACLQYDNINEFGEIEEMLVNND